MDKVIDFPGAAEVEENTSPAAIDKEEKMKRRLRMLSQYRGEVSSKNNIRNLPNLKAGEIFWVELDHGAYVVADVGPDKKGNTRIVIKKLDENATLSTGVTVFDMNKSIVEKEPLFDWQDEEKVKETREKVDSWCVETENEFYLLYGRDIHYVSLFRCVNESKTDGFFDVLSAAVKEVGELISMDFDTMAGERCIEVWVKTPEGSAELLYLMPYNRGIITFWA